MNEQEEIILYEHLKPKMYQDGDQRWRKISDCTETMQSVGETLSDNRTTVELIKADVKMFKKIGWLLVSTSTAQLILSIFEKILR